MSPSRIAKVIGRRVWDSRGRPTVEAEVLLESGAWGRGMAPAGASRGRHEAVDLRDGGLSLGGFGVARAVANVNGPLALAIRGLDASDQKAVDAALIATDGTPDKSNLGGNALTALSMATLNAAAAHAGLPLWRYLAGEGPATLPMPEVQIFGGGAHAARRVDVQDFMAMPVGATSFEEALTFVAETYRAAGELMAAAGKKYGVADEGGFWPDFRSNEEALDMLLRAIEGAGLRPGDEMAISLDIAASEFGRDGRYSLALEDRVLDSGQMIEMLVGWLRRYPIVAIEDPLAEDDGDGMAAFTRAMGERVQIIGDDFLVTSAARVEAAAAAGQCNAVLVKVNQAGTITEAKAALDAGLAAGWNTIVSARSGETEDAIIAHLATGWNALQLKVGSFARSERMAKWNECLRIEESQGSTARFATGLRFGRARA
ncbi:MAG: phosphopyruvate hydratase [Alphaproteobacteria bacterium]|nr:phosphopyruvate hydratase [Alphaproteobacteria bacterium]